MPPRSPRRGRLLYTTPQTAAGTSALTIVGLHIYADGLMSYGPTRGPVDPSVGARIERLLYMDLVPGPRPLLLTEFGVEPTIVPTEAVQETLTELSRAAGPCATPEPAGAPVLLLGQYLSARCSHTPPYAMFGLPIGGKWGGMFSELLLVPWAEANLVPLADGVTAAAAAAASGSLTDAYCAVLSGLRIHPAAPVLVMGGLTHGLYACALAAALGSSEIVYVDADDHRRSIAESYGAQSVGDIRELHRRQFPVSVDASADPRRLADALRATAPGGHCHSVGIYFQPTEVPLMSMYMDAVTFTTGRPDVGPHLPAVLDLLASESVDPMPVYSGTIAFDDLPEALLELPRKPLVLA